MSPDAHKLGLSSKILMPRQISRRDFGFTTKGLGIHSMLVTIKVASVFSSCLGEKGSELIYSMRLYTMVRVSHVELSFCNCMILFQ